MVDQIREESLSQADVEHLKSSIRTSLISFLFILIFSSTIIWAIIVNDIQLFLKMVISVTLLLVAIGSVWTIIDPLKSLRHGRKTIRVGLIEDVYEKFFVIFKKGGLYEGKMEFFYRFHGQDHRFEKISFDREKNEIKNSTNTYLPGQSLLTEKSCTDALLLEKIIKGRPLPVISQEGEMTIDFIHHKIRSKVPILKYAPREIVTKGSPNGEYFYFHLNDRLIRVDQDCFERYPSLTIIRFRFDPQEANYEVSTDQGWKKLPIFC